MVIFFKLIKSNGIKQTEFKYYVKRRGKKTNPSSGVFHFYYNLKNNTISFFSYQKIDQTIFQ